MPKCSSVISACTASTKSDSPESASPRGCTQPTEVPSSFEFPETRRASSTQELLSFRVAVERALSCALPVLETFDKDLADALVRTRGKSRLVIHRAFGVIMTFSLMPEVCDGLEGAGDFSAVVKRLDSARGWMEDLQNSVRMVVDDYIEFEEHMHYLVQCIEVVADDAALNYASEGPGDGRKERKAGLEVALAELRQAAELFATPCSCFGSSAMAEGGLSEAVSWAREMERQLISGASLDKILAYCDGFCLHLEQLHATF